MYHMVAAFSGLVLSFTRSPTATVDGPELALPSWAVTIMDIGNTGRYQNLATGTIPEPSGRTDVPVSW